MNGKGCVVRLGTGYHNLIIISFRANLLNSVCCCVFSGGLAQMEIGMASPIGDKPLSESAMTQSTEAYMSHQAPRPSFPCIWIPMLKIRRSCYRLIFDMRIPILVRRHLYIETAHCRSQWLTVRRVENEFKFYLRYRDHFIPWKIEFVNNYPGCIQAQSWQFSLWFQPENGSSRDGNCEYDNDIHVLPFTVMLFLWEAYLNKFYTLKIQHVSRDTERWGSSWLMVPSPSAAQRLSSGKTLVQLIATMYVFIDIWLIQH